MAASEDAVHFIAYWRNEETFPSTCSTSRPLLMMGRIPRWPRLAVARGTGINKGNCSILCSYYSLLFW
jgi:hypothetical protein